MCGKQLIFVKVWLGKNDFIKKFIGSNVTQVTLNVKINIFWLKVKIDKIMREF
jgi:hypothetical protein